MMRTVAIEVACAARRIPNTTVDLNAIWLLADKLVYALQIHAHLW